MCPDHAEHDTPAENPTMREDDQFRRTIEVAEGPNVDGAMQQIVETHTRLEEQNAPQDDAVKTESPIDSAMGETRAIEPEQKEG